MPETQTGRADYIKKVMTFLTDKTDQFFVSVLCVCVFLFKYGKQDKCVALFLMQSAAKQCMRQKRRPGLSYTISDIYIPPSG